MQVSRNSSPISASIRSRAHPTSLPNISPTTPTNGARSFTRLESRQSDVSKENDMLLHRRKFLNLAASAVAMPAVVRAAFAQSYPSRPVHVLVGYAAGSASDIIARLMAQRLSEQLGQQFVVENRPGAATNLAAQDVTRAQPDGYTLLLASSANTVNATLYSNLNFDLSADIVPVALIDVVPYVLEVNPSLPAKTVAEFIAYAKANPGKINMASNGIGSG